jgi:hypothetical protein
MSIIESHATPLPDVFTKAASAVHITTKVVRSNPPHGEEDSIQLFVIAFVIFEQSSKRKLQYLKLAKIPCKFALTVTRVSGLSILDCATPLPDVFTKAASEIGLDEIDVNGKDMLGKTVHKRQKNRRNNQE